MPKVARTTPRNPELIPGVPRLGRTASRKSRGTFKAAKKTTPAAEKKEVKATNEPRFYAADDVAKPIPSRKANHKPTKLKANYVPGTVLIVLAGRFKGKRVVFLKQLESGLLLVTGPYKINGVPLRRINQAYTIATSTHVDVNGVDVAAINDAFFAKAETENKKKDGEKFFEQEAKKNVVSAERKAAQKAVDTVLLKAVEAVPQLYNYLNAKFTLTKNQFPHQLKF